MLEHRIFGDDGSLVERRVADAALGTVVTYDGAGAELSTDPIDPDVLADLRAEEREERQLARVDTALADLKARERLIVSEFRQDAGPVDLRTLARRNNEHAAILKDLIRLVRNMAAEDEV